MGFKKHKKHVFFSHFVRVLLKFHSQIAAQVKLLALLQMEPSSNSATVADFVWMSPPTYFIPFKWWISKLPSAQTRQVTAPHASAPAPRVWFLKQPTIYQIPLRKQRQNSHKKTQKPHIFRILSFQK